MKNGFKAWILVIWTDKNQCLSTVQAHIIIEIRKEEMPLWKKPLKNCK